MQITGRASCNEKRVDGVPLLKKKSRYKIHTAELITRYRRAIRVDITREERERARPMDYSGRGGRETSSAAILCMARKSCLMKYGD